MYNNFVKPNADSKPEKRQRRKPVCENFVPKRLAVSIDPPMIILEYMTPETGKLYHHKMRLQSKMQETFDTKQLLDYLKKKHVLYFTKGNPKLKDAQVEQLIEKIVSQYQQYEESQQPQAKQEIKQPPKQASKVPKVPVVKDFDFLDDQQEEDVEQQYGKEQWNLQMDDDADIV